MKDKQNKQQRVVLNLTTEHARNLIELLRFEQSELARKICIRLQNTITKQQNSKVAIEEVTA